MNHELNQIKNFSKEVADSPFGRIMAQTLGVEKDAYAEDIRTALCEGLDRNLAMVAAGVETWCLSTAPQAVANCERLAVLGPKHASEFLKVGVDLSVLAMQDWEGALSESNRLVSEMWKVIPKGQVDPYDLATFFFQMAKGFSEVSNLAKQWLEEFKKLKLGVLAGYVLYSSQLARATVHELMSSLNVGDRRINPRDPSDYTVGMFMLLALGRPDVIQQGLHFRFSNQVSTSVITHRYVELGGEQHVLESVVEASLDKNWQMVANAPFLTGARQAAEDVINKAVSFAENRQQWESQVLAEKERLEKLSQPTSLDVPVQTEEGESVLLVDLMPSQPDLMEAVPSYYEAVSSLPENMQPIFRRALEEGETPKEAAINLGYQWTSASERKAERMIKKIYEEMLS
ncbi:hypothetical protein ES703_72622 [subsurface metagenome]